MKIVIAPDSFKESLSAKQVAQSIENGFRTVFPDAQYVHLPLADGGEGTVEVLMQGLSGETRYSTVEGPLGAPVKATWALLNEGKTALIEIAAASGLDLVAPEQRNPAIASTFGTGQIIREALDLGVDKILLGLGGSATNDGGAGIIQALGGKLRTVNGDDVKRGGLALSSLDSIDLTHLHSQCTKVKFEVACDVSNPLVGDNGASRIFGPQKGANQTLVAQLDASLGHFASVFARDSNIEHHKSTGFGAAGGTPMGLAVIFDIEIKAGIELVLDVLNANQIIQDATLVITGEGQMDNQTLQGKTPFGIAKRAKQAGIPVIGIAGSLGDEVDDLYQQIDAIYGTVRAPMALNQVLEEADRNLTRTARNIATTLKLGQNLLVK